MNILLMHRDTVVARLRYMAATNTLSSVDEMLDATQCGGMQNCRKEQRCMTHELWVTLNDKIYEFLSSVTLADEVERQLQQTGAALPVLRNARQISEAQSLSAMAL